MKTSDAIALYETAQAVAAVLGITRQAVEAWGDIVPEGSAYKLQVVSAGRLQANPADYQKKTASR